MVSDRVYITKYSFLTKELPAYLPVYSSLKEHHNSYHHQYYGNQHHATISPSVTFYHCGNNLRKTSLKNVSIQRSANIRTTTTNLAISTRQLIRPQSVLASVSFPSSLSELSIWVGKVLSESVCQWTKSMTKRKSLPSNTGVAISATKRKQISEHFY